MADRFDEHGYALSDIRDPEPQGVSVPVVTFEAYRKSDGAKVVVDDRVFDPEQHSLDPIEPSEEVAP